jgi:hypothetical protein
MSKVQTRNMRRKRRQGNMTPKRAYNHTIKGLIDSEGNESPFAKVRRMMIRMFNELKVELTEDTQKQLNESQENRDKKIEKTQKQLNEIKKDVDKLLNKTKEIVKKKKEIN